jgi:uncharacterized protein YndB with AHSA1/START domain
MSSLETSTMPKSPSTSAPDTSVRKSVVVRVPPAHAFRVFTEQFDAWWPRTHHIGKVEPYKAILEPRAGGRWFERGADGSECDWGQVLEYSPPMRVALSWHLGSDFRYDPDPAKASRVDVTFTDEGNGTTRVQLVHSQLERHGADWTKVRDSVASKGGWDDIMDLFAAAPLF